MTTLVILLRLVHIFSGVFWVGGSAVSLLYLFPVANALGPDGAKFMQGLIVTRAMRRRWRLPVYSPSWRG